MKLTKEQLAFFTLVRAGLWEKEVQLSHLGAIDFSEVQRLTEEQSLVGLVAAGLEHITDIKVPKVDVLQFIGQALQVEQQNTAMNYFIGVLEDKMKEEGIRALLVKGQAVAQCYERPAWRSCGDVDLLLDEENYEKAKAFLTSIANDVHEENPFDQHFSVNIQGWCVELHGTMRSMLTKRADDYLEALQIELFKEGRNRVWNNDGTQVLLPCPDDDVIFVFTHILKHFFNYGIGLRQFCDLCRLVYTYHKEMDLALLESRLRSMGLMTEWKVFGSLAVNWLGMPEDTMPLYSTNPSWKRKANRVVSFVLDTGNFGHNRDNEYYRNANAIVRGIRSFWRHTCDSIRHTFIFPMDSVRIWFRVFFIGLNDVIKGKT